MFKVLASAVLLFGVLASAEQYKCNSVIRVGSSYSKIIGTVVELKSDEFKVQKLDELNGFSAEVQASNGLLFLRFQDNNSHFLTHGDFGQKMLGLHIGTSDYGAELDCVLVQ